VLVAASDDANLLRTVRSLGSSQGTGWELVISTSRLRELGSTRATVDRLLGTRVVWGSQEPDATGLPTQSTLATASGDYVAILGEGDQVEPGVLPALIDYLDARPFVDVLYTDEQWPASGAEGILTKPDWVPHYLEGSDYLGRLCLMRRTLVEAAGGLRDRFPDAREWDLHLRVTELTDAIEHVPTVGVTRPAGPATSRSTVEAGRAAVTDRLRRLDVAGRVEIASPEGFLRVWRDVPEPLPLVSIVIPTAGGTREVRGETTVLLEKCLRGLVERTTYPNWEVVLVPSAGTPAPVIAAAAEIVGERLVVAEADGPFSFSYSVNEGVRNSKGEFVLLLNDDTDVIEPRWLDRMVAVAQDSTVGVVGAKLYFENMTIQHVGVIHDDAWSPHHAHRTEVDGAGHFGSKVLDMDYPAVTGACLLTRRSLYIEVGGFSELLPLAYNDVDFCVKVTTAGYRVVCTPFARLFHYESSTRAPDVRPFERQYHDEYLRPLATLDPYVNYRSVR
jgi:glycosyltransferase involved in cell wall biosynthesis